MAVPTVAATAKRLANDNRLLVTSVDPTDSTKVVVYGPKVPTTKQLRFGGTSYTTGTAKGTAATHTVPPDPADNAAYYSSVPGTDLVVVVPIDVTAVNSVSPNARTGWFSYMGGSGIIRKLCYVDQYGTPLTSAGVPINTKDATTGVWTRGSVATDAADATTTALSAQGSAAPTGFQDGLPVGVYQISPLGQTSSNFAPWPGWTAQQ